MPVSIDTEIRRLSQEEFGAIAFEVMREAFEIHRELGRFFDEAIYHGELIHRRPGARSKVAITVAFDTFRKQYCVDLLVGGGAAFELKAAEALHDRHRAQLLNDLLLMDLGHGKLINFRTEAVQHEFVNTTLHRGDRTAFEVDDRQWQACDSCSAGLKESLVALLRDVGTGLDLELYQEAIIHGLGGPAFALDNVDVIVAGRRIGRQEVICTPDRFGIRLTVLKPEAQRSFAEHHLRFLRHTDLVALHWINITRSVVTFRTLFPNG